ncbi:MAG: hypothetical protein MRY64_00645 [Hyphomonadaceae bacterium]|nr:hypothetical protein [Hyphomonadaceae bacterium]
MKHNPVLLLIPFLIFVWAAFVPHKTYFEIPLLGHDPSQIVGAVTVATCLMLYFWGGPKERG